MAYNVRIMEKAEEDLSEIVDYISDMLKNADCVNAIKNGECSLKLREYKSKYGKLCYDFDFVDTPKTETTEKQADIF